MNKLGKSLLAASLMVGAANAASSVNKTYLAGRPVGVNLPMEGTTWHSQVHMPEGNEEKFGGSFQMVGFYQENTNEKDIGRYLGVNNKNTLVVGAAGVSGEQGRVFDHMDG